MVVAVTVGAVGAAEVERVVEEDAVAWAEQAAWVAARAGSGAAEAGTVEVEVWMVAEVAAARVAAVVAAAAEARVAVEARVEGAAMARAGARVRAVEMAKAAVSVAVEVGAQVGTRQSS